MTLTGKKWVEAARILAKDPTAIVQCPQNGDGELLVRDVVSPDAPDIIERFLTCEKCGAWNSIRLQGSGSLGSLQKQRK